MQEDRIIGRAEKQQEKRHSQLQR